LTCQGFKSRAEQIRQHYEAEMGTPWSAMARASASIDYGEVESGGGSVTSFISNNTSSWS
jgi:hypothetical protein